jgi:hypothetical protein
MNYTNIQIGRWITSVVIIFGLAAALGFDLWVLAQYGPETTISAVINAWAYSYLGDRLNYLVVFGFGFLNGAALVHFLGWGPILDKPVENSNIFKKEKNNE